MIAWVCLQILVWLFAPRPQFSDGSEKYHWFSFIQLFLVVRTEWRLLSFFNVRTETTSPHLPLISIETISNSVELLYLFLSIHSPSFQQPSLRLSSAFHKQDSSERKRLLWFYGAKQNCLPNVWWQNLKHVFPNWVCTIKFIYSEFYVSNKYGWSFRML